MVMRRPLAARPAGRRSLAWRQFAAPVEAARPLNVCLNAAPPRRQSRPAAPAPPRSPSPWPAPLLERDRGPRPPSPAAGYKPRLGTCPASEPAPLLERDSPTRQPRPRKTLLSIGLPSLLTRPFSRLPAPSPRKSPPPAPAPASPGPPPPPPPESDPRSGREVLPPASAPGREDRRMTAALSRKPAAVFACRPVLSLYQIGRTSARPSLPEPADFFRGPRRARRPAPVRLPSSASPPSPFCKIMQRSVL